MSLSEASSATGGTTKSPFYYGILLFGDENLAEPCTATIFYKKPSIEEITSLGTLNLLISYDGENYCNIHCYVENLKYASEGVYYGPIKICVDDKRENGAQLKLYIPEDMCKKLEKLNAETPLYYKNELGFSSMIYKYILDRPACRSCDLSLAPTRTRRDFESSSTSHSESEGPSLIHYDSKIHGVINIMMDFPSVAYYQLKLIYVIPLEEDIRKCSSIRIFPLQFMRSDASFQIFPCVPGNLQNGAFWTNDCVFDIKVIKNDQTETSWECYIPNFPALLEGLLSCNTHCLVENLKNAYPGIYYGPYKIFVEDKRENGSTFKCYFREDMNEELQKWKNCQSLYFTNNDGKKSWIYRYILDLPACKLCNLSYVPTRLPRNMASSSTSSSETQGFPQIDPDPTVYGTLENNLVEFSKLYKKVILKYVVPFEDDIRKCIESGSPFPLQFEKFDKCFCIRPCYPEHARFISSDTNSTPCEIQVVNDNGDLQWMECRIQNYLSLVEREMGSSIECCHYTIIYTNGKKDRTAFTYTKPEYSDFTNGRNRHLLETFEGGQPKQYPVYCGDIDSFDPDFYFGPFLIQSVYDDGTRGPWLDCYFRKNPDYHQKEDMIKKLVQELEIESRAFKFKKNPLDGIGETRYNTSVTYLNFTGSHKVRRTITVDYFPRNNFSGSEI